MPRRPWHCATLLAATVALPACVSLPQPDGIEAAIIERAASLPALSPAEGRSLTGIARNSLLLSPDVREAASNVSASADEVRVQRASLFPRLNMSLGGGIGDAGSGDPAIELTGSQLLFDGGNTKRSVKIADYDLQIRYLSFQKEIDDTLLESLNAYQDVQTQSELLEIYKGLLQALKDLETLVAARVENGAVSYTDILETRKRVQSAEFLVHDTQLILAEAKDRLSLLTGESTGGHVSIMPSSCRAEGDTDSLRIAQLEISRARMAYEKAEKALTPRVLLKPVLRGEVGTDKLPAGLNLDIQSDLLQGGALTARANAARNTLAAAEAKLDSVRLEDTLSEQGLVRSIATGDQKSDMLERQIALLSQTRELYRSQYFDMGTRRLSELLDNEEEYYSRMAELVELRSALSTYRIECAVRSRELRGMLNLEENSIYGYPLTSEEL